MNCPSRRATAISPAGRSHRARIPTVVPECAAGPRRSVRWYPASADRSSPHIPPDMALPALPVLRRGVAPGRLPQKNRQKRNSKPTASTSIQATRRRTTIVQQSAPAKTRQPNSHTPLNPAILVGHKESQAVCKLHSSSRSIALSVLSKLTTSTITTQVAGKRLFILFIRFSTGAERAPGS